MKTIRNLSIAVAMIIVLGAIAIGVYAQRSTIKLPANHAVDIEIPDPVPPQTPVDIVVLERTALDDEGQPTTWRVVWLGPVDGQSALHIPVSAPNGKHSYRAYAIDAWGDESPEKLEADLIAHVNSNRPPKVKPRPGK